ncbi:MAG: family 10 glycosylhydrolase [Candidatus Sumerlaeaceae bacterium]|jgi:uncharacterized lipoprotein YddW (UPF0748 family)
MPGFVSRISSLVLSIFAISALATAEERILWYSIGDGLTSTTNMQNAINFAVTNNFNAICFLARYRADAYYIPNRDFSTYPNPEPAKSGAAGDSLQFIIDRAHEAGLRVYISFGCFLVTDGSNTYPSYLPAGAVQWIYKDVAAPTASDDTTYNPDAGYPRPTTTADTSEGLWIDPGRNDVRQYTRNILKDIVLNYDIDGVIFDRVRYPGDALPHRNEAYGYNPQALSDMGLNNPGPGSTTFINARRQAVANFISEARADVHAIKPWIIVGAAPVVYGTTLTDTYSTVFQYFPMWNTMSNSNHVNGLGILDMVAPQYYRSTAAANATLMDLAKPDVTNMVHQATFYTVTEPAAEMAQSICDTRNATRGMKGFGIYTYAGASASGFMSTLNSTSTSPCGTGVMASASPLVDYTLKVNWDSQKPNNITNLAADTSTPGRVRLTWSTPPTASDGDVPVRYLVYRSTSTPVKLYYSNLVNRNYEVTGNEFIDEPSKGLTAGTFYYKVIPVDDYNNKGDSNLVGPVSPSFPEFIIETRSGGQNSTKYTEISGDWQNSTSKSTAAGVTSGIGSRFATLDTKNDVARFTLAGIPGVPSGQHYYDIYYTTNNVSSTNCVNCTYRVKTASGIVSGTFDVLPSTTGNQWYKVASGVLLDSADAYFEVDSSSSTTTPNGLNTRLPADAVKFAFVQWLPVTLSQLMIE